MQAKGTIPYWQYGSGKGTSLLPPKNNNKQTNKHINKQKTHNKTTKKHTTVRNTEIDANDQFLLHSGMLLAPEGPSHATATDTLPIANCALQEGCGKGVPALEH